MLKKLWLGGSIIVLVAACGARSQLFEGDNAGDGGNPAGGAGGAGGFGGMGGFPPEPCLGVKEKPCGSNIGECSQGVQTCQPDGTFGPCIGAIDPVEESCNSLDDNCDGVVDEGFGLGLACDGPDNDLCADDVMTCDGCSLGPDILEVCNGIDDNCNGITDSDCEVGACSPTLLVTGSTPSNPNCVDLPVEAGSTGVIHYPCAGGFVSAQLGNILFSGTVTNGIVALMGSEQIIGPDGCTWINDHFINGSIPGGTVQYSYQETLVPGQPGPCWFPCTETGAVTISWTP